ncbi:MAG TPA: PEP/pyruvate-binding domain-containing protein, partial [bacterium]|nr:PEP/pyruvate-binding domain-containing protein [bacterium]
MAGREEFQSEALRVNLERTRFTDVVLAEAHQWLLDAAGSAFGVQKRLKAFFQEFMHPYSNMDQTVELFRDAVLNDLWFYVRNTERERALGVVLDLFRQVLNRGMTPHLKERLAVTLLEFMNRLRDEIRSGDDGDIATILHESLSVLEESCRSDAILMRRASWFLKTASKSMAGDPDRETRWTALHREALAINLAFWRDVTNYREWLASWDLESHPDLAALADRLGEPYFDDIESRMNAAASWRDLSKVDDFVAMSDHFRHAREQIASPLEQTYFVLYLLKHPGMEFVRDPLLWDLNRVIQRIGDELREEQINGFIDRLFDFFEHLKAGHMSTVLDCIRTLGRAVYERNSILCIEHFQDRLVELGFVGPNCPCGTRSWQVEVDPNHVKNIRVWLEIIECRPELSTRLIAGLIINLKVSGMFIADTDLFQRDITKLVNADIERNYLMVRELARVFPVYFNEIGAEGTLRDVTTQIDEHSNRQDRLIHYLRKQVHTESNSTHIQLTETIARFWYSGDPQPLKALVPADVTAAMETSGPWFDPVHRAVSELVREFGVTPEGALLLNPGMAEAHLKEVKAAETEPVDCYRTVKLIELYQLLRDKYTLDDQRVIDKLKQNPLTQQKAMRLESLLEKNNPDAALHFVFSILQQLRKIITHPEVSKADESIYQKRHIAVGIPSMYGRYSEPKFESLGLTFRLEKLASSLMDQAMAQVNLRYISASTLRRIAQILSHYQKGLRLTGIVHEGFNTNVRMLYYSLNTTGFSIQQYVNLFQFLMRNVRQIIQTYFIRPFDKTLKEILLQQFHEHHREDPDSAQLRELHGRAETFYRERLTSAFLVSRLDNYTARILDTLNRMAGTLTPDIIDSVMTYDPDLMSSPIYQSSHDLDSQIFLGAKGYFLKRLFSYRFPVPPGFILTTEMFRRRVAISRYPEMSREVFKLVKGHIGELERMTGKRYGDPKNPLLLSVRSGAAISLPGAMNTFLNVGMNDHIVELLSYQKNYGWTSWDCYRRFLQSWGMAYGISRDEFDAVIIAFKKRYGVEEKITFRPAQMRTIALAYKDILVEHGVKFEEDPFRQIMQAIMVVMDSWNTSRAKIFRERLQIASDWGTAVIIQQMVLGNINDDSGTGVVFTHDPAVDEPGVFLFGDFTMCSQGEDVVAGLVHTLPISERQRRRSPQGKNISLEKDFPEIYRALLDRAGELINRHGFGHQEIEFTFESSRREDLYILQTRDHSWGRDDEIPVFRDHTLKDKV